MVMLDKRRTSLWIKIGALIIVVAFVAAYIPSLMNADFSSFLSSIFKGTPTGAENAQVQTQINNLKAAIKKNPKDIPSLVQLGDIYYDAGDYKNAITYYEKSLKLDPKNYDVLTNLGSSYFKLNNLDKTLQVFQKVNQERPDQAMAWFNLGVVYKAKGDTPNMRFAWERYLALEPTGEQADMVRQELSGASSQ